MRSACWKRMIKKCTQIIFANKDLTQWNLIIIIMCNNLPFFAVSTGPGKPRGKDWLINLGWLQYENLQHNLTLTTVGVPQVRDEDKSSYVAEWASKHAFGPPSPQADHHGESWGDLDEKVLDFERKKQWLPPSGPPSPLTTTSSLSCKSRRKLPPTPHSLPTHSPEVVLLWSEQTLRSLKLWKACRQLNSQQQPVRKLKMKLVSTFLSISFSAFGFLQNVKLNSKPTSLHVHSYLYQPH